jgi:hypothetical protein
VSQRSKREENGERRARGKKELPGMYSVTMYISLFKEKRPKNCTKLGWLRFLYLN